MASRSPVRAPLRTAHLLLLLALGGAACGGSSGTPTSLAGVTPDLHAAFPIATGPHAVDCARCHAATAATFTAFDCTGCHTRAPSDAVHTTAAGYAFASASCYACHADPLAHPYDHAGATTCAACHQPQAAYAALPVAGFVHADVGTTDCSACHVTSSWTTGGAPGGLVADPAAAVAATGLVPRYSGTSIVSLSAQPQTLPMPMDHASGQVALSGVACTACHDAAGSGSFYPGHLHSSLANLLVPEPTACSDCHAGSAPVGFVGPTAASPARTPPSGEMKHDAVLWSAGRPAATRAVTADCGACHVCPSATIQATWSSGPGGAPATFHLSLLAAALPQPISCVDCHANSRPPAALTSAAAALPAGLSFDHAAAAGGQGDCAGCHAGTSAWSGGRFHAAGSATPASCLPCHEGQRPASTAGWTAAGYAATPFDYGANAAGIGHGDGLDCVTCHAGPGTGGAWGGSPTWAGGHFGHGPASAAAATCAACHQSQRPDLVLGVAQATAALGFDHSASSTGDCIGCHQATATAGSYARYFSAGGTLPGGDWQGGKAYPGATLVSAPGQFVIVTSLALVRSAPGALATGTIASQATLTNAMLHTSAAVPAQLAPGPAATPDMTSCWHCHVHDAAGTVTSFASGQYHASLTGYSATPGGTVTPLPQPATGCLDCHAQMRPPGVVEQGGSDLVAMDHGATFAAPATIAGQTVSGVAGLDCATCHKQPGVSWQGGAFHASIGAATPADCVACHYPLMADASAAGAASGTLYRMAHGSAQLTFQACASCHQSALAQAQAPFLATDWRPGAFHASLSAQPTACLDCHAVSEPHAGASTQSSWSYTLAAGATVSNQGQWMNHGALEVVGKDCAACHAADARPSGAAWSRSTELHAVAARPQSCQVCHGLANGGGSVPGTSNNLPSGLTSSSMLTTASADATTGVPAGTHDQLSHADINVSSQDCGFCHTQAGRSTAAGIQGAEWAQARFHTSLSPAVPLTLNGTTGRCSNCHLALKPGTAFAAFDHSALSGAAGTQDCSACHSWPGTGTATAPSWLGATAMPQFIAVGGFAIPQPPATAPTTQKAIANLPHPTVAAGASCSACHTGGVGGQHAIGYDHASTLINASCSACHEAGSNLLGTAWNGAATQAAGAGDTRPFTIATLTARRTNGDSCTVTAANHFYPVDCYQCHAVPAGTGAVTTGTAYTNTAWSFPHTETRMTNPATCNLCHTGPSCPR